MNELSTEIVIEVWRLLVEHCGASDDDVSRDTFVQYAAGLADVKEYRFQGALGFGGKVRLNSARWSVDCYPEDANPERVEIIEKTNQALAELKERMVDEPTCEDIDAILPLVKELTPYQSLVYVALYNQNIASAEDAIRLVAKHRNLIEDHKRRRFEPAATARAIIEQEASGQPTGPPSKEAEARARSIIKRISDAAIELAFVRHSLTNDEFDETNYPDAADGVEAIKAFVEEIKTDTLNCLTGDDSGCLDPEELDETNCELLWLQKVLVEMIAQPELSRYERALIFAARAHSNQRRKYTNEPYLNHPIAVAGMLMDAGFDEDVVIAGLLHDVIENTSVVYGDIRREFGAHVADLVLAVTDIIPHNELDRASRKAKYRNHLATTSMEAQSLKAADIIHNVPTMVEHDPKFAKIYLAEKRALLAVLIRADHNLLRRAREVLEAGEKTNLRDLHS